MYASLLEKFRKVPQGNIFEESFISICGFPHRELVFSNIFGFFFDTSREQNLGDLFVKSLIESIDSSPADYLCDYIAEREVRTEKGNFIDLLLRNDQKNIVIENKVKHILNNDLDDYYETASEEGKEKPLGVVLSLYAQNETNHNFKYVTYKKFLSSIKRNLGNYIGKANKKYLPFLLDFFDSIENLEENNQMDEKFLNFICENEEESIQFVKSIGKFRKDLRNKVSDLKQSINDIIDDKSKNVKLWLWRDLSDFFDDCVVDCFFINNTLDISIDSTLTAHGWNFSIWIRKNDSEKSLSIEDVVKLMNFDGKVDNKRYNLSQVFTYQESMDNVAKFVVDIIDKVNSTVPNML